MDSGKLFALKEIRNDLYRQHQAKMAEFLAQRRVELSQRTRSVDLYPDFRDDERVPLSEVLAFLAEKGLDPASVVLISSSEIELVTERPLTPEEVDRDVEACARGWANPEIGELAVKIQALDAQILREVLG